MPTSKIFQAPSAERGEGGGGNYALFSKNGLILHNFGLIKQSSTYTCKLENKY